jgi:polar amino acid transport system permease protein
MPIALDFAAVLQEWPILLKGMTWTLGLTTVSALLGLILGIAAAWMRTECVGWGRILVATYVELIRNT